jgi:Mg2+ and Co2+ transporter CorA
MSACGEQSPALEQGATALVTGIGERHDLGLEGDLRARLIWGVAFTRDGQIDLANCDDGVSDGFRWLHLNLADRRTRQWIEASAELPAEIQDLLLSSEAHQRSVAQDACVACCLHDFERDFEHSQTDRIGSLRIALTPRMVITARLHPMRSADIVRRRIEAGAHLENPAEALDLMVSAICQNIGDVARSLERQVQAAEDSFLEGHHPPDSRDLMALRRRLAQVHRLLDGMRSVFQRLERDSDVPETIRPMIESLSQRLLSLDSDILGVQGQLRALREELNAQQDQRTNQNLYLLSIMTALMLPTTLVTGIFGMNTGDMPLSGPAGTAVAILLAAIAAAGTYALLRVLGFIRR